MLTANVLEPEPLVHPLKHPCHWPACPLQAPDVDRRPRGGGQRGDESHPRRQESRRRARQPSLLWCRVPHPAPGAGRGRELSGPPPDGRALVRPDAPAGPLPPGLAWCLQPSYDRAGLARRRFEPAGGGWNPPHDVRLLAAHAGDAHPVPSAVVGDRAGAGRPGQGEPTFAPLPSRHTDLGEPAGGAVIRQRQPPVVPRAARLPERAGRHAQDTTPRAGGLRVDRPRGGHQGAEAPAPPGLTGPEPVAPSGLGEISASPLSTAQAPRRRVDRAPQTSASTARHRSTGLARPRTRWKALGVRAWAARSAGNRGTTSRIHVSATSASGTSTVRSAAGVKTSSDTSSSWFW